MSSKIRKQIYLDKRLDNLVRQKAKRTGRSQAEVIRDTLSNALDAKGERPELEAWRDLKKFFEERAKLKSNLKGRTWKREDLYEERLRWPRHG